MEGSKIIIVGLGNPGSEYRGTRHNLGFEVIDALAKKLEGPSRFSKNSKLLSEVSIVDISKTKVILVKPLTYMNLSGDAVKRVKDYYGVSEINTIVCSDDINLDIGKVRVRFGGKPGGHNGLKSVINSIGESFWRLRVGVGNNEKIPQEKYVLGKIQPENQELFDKLIDNAAKNLVEYITQGEIKNTTIN